MTYKVAIGHDNTGGLADISPQPACEGLQYEEWGESDLGAYPIGRQTAELVYDEVLETTEYTGLLTAFGLTAAASAAVTLTLPKDDRTMGNYNCYISLPKTLKYKHWYRGVRFAVQVVEEI